MGTYDRSDPLRSQNQQREERGGSDFLIIIFSYNAGYAKHRGVKKPLSQFWAFLRPPRLNLSSGGLFYNNCVFCVFFFLHTFFLLLICYSIRFITTTV